MSSGFMNFIARVVLVSYLTQLFAPVAYACDLIRPDPTSPFRYMNSTMCLAFQGAVPTFMRAGH
jgi:hypothetical protein